MQESSTAKFHIKKTGEKLCSETFAGEQIRLFFVFMCFYEMAWLENNDLR